MIKAAGFEQVQIKEKINTLFGTLDLITAKKTDTLKPVTQKTNL
ncbi:hypothetical protein BH23BAC3_BH23BAC3_32200 [soil metagenome]